MNELELFDRSRLEESGRTRFLRLVVLAGRPAFCACMHLVAGRFVLLQLFVLLGSETGAESSQHSPTKEQIV